MADAPWQANTENFAFPPPYHQITRSHGVESPWSPVCLSSPSLSTEYWSNRPSPFQSPFARTSDLSSPPTEYRPNRPSPHQSPFARTSELSSGGGKPSQLSQTTNNPDIVFSGAIPVEEIRPPNPRPTALGPQSFPPPADNTTKKTLLNDYDPVSMGEQISWFEPYSVEGCLRPRSGSSEGDIADYTDAEPIAETPEEFLRAIPQNEVDKNIKEMTCGPKLAERFWPIRYQLSNGKKNLYENTIHTLIAHARRELRPDILSSLTSELAFGRAESSRLPSFLDESWARYERLRKIASEMGATDLPCFREAVWEDRLTIILVFYEVLTSKRDSEDVLKLRGAGAQFMLDLMQDAIQAHINLWDLLRGGSPRIRGPRKDFLKNALEQGLLRNVDRAAAHFDARRLIVQLSELSDLLPSSLVIHGVKNTRPTPFSGTFGDVFAADYQGKNVALKRLRIFSAENEENPTRKKFCREALIWKNLDHDHVLPFIGVDLETFPGHLCMLSPWMAKGALVTHKGGPSETTIPVLIHEIAVGLQYLHSQSIVHGDLRGANILLDDQGHARLADFGLAAFADGPLVPTKRGGSLRWMAPELIDPESCELVSFQRTFASDIYSFGCVCLELYTGKPPFSEILSEGAVLLKVIKGHRPEFPTQDPLVPAWCQQVITMCWSHIPSDRPGAGVLIERIVKSVRKRSRASSPDGGSESLYRPPDKRLKCSTLAQ